MLLDIRMENTERKFEISHQYERTLSDFVSLGGERDIQEIRPYIFYSLSRQKVPVNMSDSTVTIPWVSNIPLHEFMVYLFSTCSIETSSRDSSTLHKMTNEKWL